MNILPPFAPTVGITRLIRLPVSLCICFLVNAFHGRLVGGMAMIGWMIATPGLQAQRSNAQAKDFLAIHHRAIVADGHNDVLGHVVDGERIDVLRKKGHSDLVRFGTAGIDIQLFSVWVPPKYLETRGEWKYALREIDSLDAIIRRNPGRIGKVTTREEMRKTLAENKIAAVVALEGGHAVGDSRQRILDLYRRGLRCFGLTWNNSTSWACSAADEFAKRCTTGLSDQGKDFIRLLDSLGVLIDVSHLSRKGFYDVLASSRNPIIASHSSCRALRDHFRNLDDEQLRAVSARNGIVMVNFYPGFIRSMPSGDMEKECRRYQRQIDAITPPGDRFARRVIEKRKRILLAARKKSVPTLLDVADHIQHVITVAGIDHVGIGSDFDGIDYGPVGLATVLDLPYLTNELLERGLTETDVTKVLGGNFLRVFDAVCK